MPNFYMLIGISGCGKSTYARKLKEQLGGDPIIVSSDAIRGFLYGDESVQDNPALIFNWAFEQICWHLNHGKSVIFDATNLNSKKRIAFLDNIKKKVSDISFNAIAIVLPLPLQQCIYSQQMRDRKVPVAAIERQLRSFQMPYEKEGWDEIRVVKSDIPYYYSIREDYERLIKVPHNSKWHKESIGEHMNMAGKYAYNNISAFPLINDFDHIDVIAAALYHDVGKDYCRCYKDGDPYAHYYNHENVGAWLFLCNNAKGIGMLNDVFVAQLICYHMLAHQLSQEKLVEKFGKKLGNALAFLKDCDGAARIL